MEWIFPNPSRWNEIYKRLLAVCQRQNLDRPPVPLILNGWAYTNDIQKAERWAATVKWAANNDASDLVKLEPSDWYSVENPSQSEIGPHGRPMHLPWRFEPSNRPSVEMVQAAIESLRLNWAIIAGEMARYTCPLRFTGNKKRRLLISVVTAAPHPSWGDWNRLAQNENRRAFTTFRHRVNETIAPLEVDHIEFVSGNLPKADHPNANCDRDKYGLF